VEQVAREYPDIELQTFIVDDFARRLVADRTVSLARPPWSGVRQRPWAKTGNGIGTGVACSTGSAGVGADAGTLVDFERRGLDAPAKHDAAGLVEEAGCPSATGWWRMTLAPCAQG
jgi:hypothetical protein